MADTNVQSQGSGLEPNISAMLCWIFAPITSIIFLVIDKDPFVKFHAIQSLIWSIVAFLGATVLATIMTFTIIFACLAWVPYLYYIVNIIGAIKAYQNEKWKLPVIGDMAESN
jgi:uncharacterized membrane protein